MKLQAFSIWVFSVLLVNAAYYALPKSNIDSPVQYRSREQFYIRQWADHQAKGLCGYLIMCKVQKLILSCFLYIFLSESNPKQHLIMKLFGNFWGLSNNLRNECPFFQKWWGLVLFLWLGEGGKTVVRFESPTVSSSLIQLLILLLSILHFHCDMEHLISLPCF